MVEAYNFYGENVTFFLGFLTPTILTMQIRIFKISKFVKEIIGVPKLLKKRAEKYLICNALNKSSIYRRIFV